MRGILINVFEEVVTEVETDGHLDDMYKMLNCQLVDVVSIGNGETIWVDDEGLLGDLLKQKFFTFEGHSEPLAGNGLILNNNSHGDNVDTKLDLLDVKKRVRFYTFLGLREMLRAK